MRSQERTLDKIMNAFAESVSAGELEKAEGWLALALWSREVSETATTEPVH
jgi:hypothetical protein